MPDPYDYVALTEIWHGGVRAYNTGDPVPADNVREHGYQVGTQVAKAGTKTASKAEAAAVEAADSAGLTPPVTTPQGPAAAAHAQAEAKPAKGKS